ESPLPERQGSVQQASYPFLVGARQTMIRFPGPGMDHEVGAVFPGPGGDFLLAYPSVSPVRSGIATGSLICGLASLPLTVIVLCFGVVGASDGWGLAVAGAFAALGTFSGLTGVGLGVMALGQVRRSAKEMAGRGIAFGGLCGGGIGLL